MNNSNHEPFASIVIIIILFIMIILKWAVVVHIVHQMFKVDSEWGFIF